MILSVMLKKELTPYIILGYVCIAYLDLPIMGVAFVGTIFSLIAYYGKNNNGINTVKNVKVATENNNEDEEDFTNGI